MEGEYRVGFMLDEVRSQVASCGPARRLRWRDRAAPQTLLINSTYDIANQTIGAYAKRLSGGSNLVCCQVTGGLVPLR
jgi:hypothetical protein